MAEKIQRSKISNTEWGLVIGALATIDVAQLLLDLTGVGAVVSSGIDVIVGLSFPFYLHIRGESMADPKRLGALLAVVGLEAVPFVNGLPFWCADGIYNLILAKRRDKIANAQALAEIDLKMKQRSQMQQEKLARLEEVRQRQLAQREQDQLTLENETTAVDDSDQDLYDEAA